MNQNFKFSSVCRERRVTKVPTLGRNLLGPLGSFLSTSSIPRIELAPCRPRDFPVNSLFAYRVGIRVSRNPHQQRAFHEITTLRSLITLLFSLIVRERVISHGSILIRRELRRRCPLRATCVRLTPAWRRERSTIFRMTEESSTMSARMSGIRAPSVGRAGCYLLSYAFCILFCCIGAKRKEFSG